jgi:hypothetical protein
MLQNVKKALANTEPSTDLPRRPLDVCFQGQTRSRDCVAPLRSLTLNGPGAALIFGEEITINAPELRSSNSNE